MQILKFKSKNASVYLLEEILNNIGYKVVVSDYFGSDTHNAVIDFQKKNKLVADGIVGVKTWTVLLKTNEEVLSQKTKFLSENDLINFSKKFNIELAAVKAVNEIESSGKGFLLNGEPKILFEGHVFWSELLKRGIDPEDYKKNNLDILYPKWTKKYYLGGENEYKRLDKAIGLSNDYKIREAALCSASWGAFQIMGYHFSKLGYKTIDEFVSKMKLSEAEHLNAFGLFLEKYNILKYLRTKEWAKFAKNYNGISYSINQYDKKLEKAYNKYKKLL